MSYSTTYLSRNISQPKGLQSLLLLAWFFVLQPYLSPIPIETDLQPFSLLLAVIALSVDAVSRNCYLRKFSLILIAAVAIELFHLLFFNKVAGVYLAAYICTAFAYRFSSRITVDLLVFVMIFHLMGILWQAYDSSSFASIFDSFMRKLKYTENSARGVTGFTPEPSFSGALSTLYAIIYFRFFARYQNFKLNVGFFLMYLIGIILTSSSLGYFFLPLVLLTLLFQSERLRLVDIVYVVFWGFFLLGGVWLWLEDFSVTQRGLRLIYLTYQDPTILFLDSSLQERFRSLFVGYHTMLETFVGLGHGNFPSATQLAKNQFDLSSLFANSRDILGSASGLGSVMAGTGFVGLFFFSGLLFSLRGYTSIADISIWVLLLAMFVFSFSPAFPLIYVILILRWKNEYSYNS